MTSQLTNRRLVFAYRPEGKPSPDVFGVVTDPVPSPAEGQILVRNLLVSIDPYLRLKMYDRRSYTPPLKIGEQIPGRGIAQVIESKAEGFKPGDLVACYGAWQEYAVVKAKAAQKIDTSIASEEHWLGTLGMTGRTAYTGLLDIGKPKQGDTLVVSGAAGAVGSLVGQIGKIFGCRVVGIAGTDEKCSVVVDEFGFDTCINYRAADFREQLAASLPNGCDIYFDNVGGEIAQAVISHSNDFARVPVCGLISQYNGQRAADPAALDEFMRLILSRRLTIRGFIVSDYDGQYPEFETEVAKWLKSGSVKQRHYIRHGFDQIAPAFIDLLSGENTGKTMVRLADAA